MLWLKSCPRCRGDIYEDRGDDRGSDIFFLQCLQCGHILTDDEERRITCVTYQNVETHQDAFV